MSNGSSAFNWPDVHRIAFGPRGDHLDAQVGWVLAQPEGMEGHIEGFRRAACAVFEQTATCGGSPDYTIFPLAFLWRHHIELSLKEAIALGRALEGESWSYPIGHDLVRLWQQLRTYLAKLQADGPEISNVEATIQELAKVDPAADGFRYPTQRGGTRALSAAPQCINLAQLHEAMDALSRFLSAVCAALRTYLDGQRDAEAHSY